MVVYDSRQTSFYLLHFIWYLPRPVNSEKRKARISGPDKTAHQILLSLDYSLRLAPSCVQGLQGFTDPMYLHRSE